MSCWQTETYDVIHSMLSLARENSCTITGGSALMKNARFHKKLIANCKDKV